MVFCEKSTTMRFIPSPSKQSHRRSPHRTARRVARTLDLKVIGTIGLVAWAKSTGLIRLAAPVLDELCRAGMRVSTPLIDEVLDLVGEPR